MSKIGILIALDPKNEGFTGVARFEEAGKKRGHEVERLYAPFFTFRHDGERVEVLYENVPFEKYDALVYRPNFIEEPSLHLHVPELLRRVGHRVLNGAPGVAETKNKLAQHVRFAEAGLPLPRWAIAKEQSRSLAAAQAIGFPVIVKTPFGTHGVGVFYADSPETFMPIVDYLAVSDGNPAIIEEFVAEAGRKDLRVFTLGDRVLAAMERTAKPGDVRANASNGGTGAPVELTEEERSLAVRAARLFGLDFAGVDLLRSKRGSLLIEVNANPGFAELERATGVDVAGAVLDAAVS